MGSVLVHLPSVCALPQIRAEKDQEMPSVEKPSRSQTRPSSPCQSGGDGLEIPPGSAFKLAMAKVAQATFTMKWLPNSHPFLSSPHTHAAGKKRNHCAQ